MRIALVSHPSPEVEEEIKNLLMDQAEAEIEAAIRDGHLPSHSDLETPQATELDDVPLTPEPPDKDLAEAYAYEARHSPYDEDTSSFPATRGDGNLRWNPLHGLFIFINVSAWPEVTVIACPTNGM